MSPGRRETVRLHLERGTPKGRGGSSTQKRNVDTVTIKSEVKYPDGRRELTLGELVFRICTKILCHS